jgi:serine/threonine protein kinase
MCFRYMPRGSLYDVLHNKEIVLSIDLLMRMLLDCSRGMSYLHKRLIHRDLVSEYICLCICC